MARQGHAFATSHEVRVVYQNENADLIDVPADGKTVGEIVTRGNIVMKEVRLLCCRVANNSPDQYLVMFHRRLWKYFRDPEATQKAFRNGYFGTGDLAVMHPDGTVAIQDRSKDIIISGGEVHLVTIPVCVAYSWICRMPRV